jgi:hypothetical protein
MSQRGGIPTLCRVRRPLTEIGQIRIQDRCRTSVTQGYTSRQLMDKPKRWMSASASTTSARPLTSTLHPGPGLLVAVVGLEGGEILPLGRGQLRPGRSAEGHVLAIHEMVHRQDHRPPPADTDREARRRSG